MGQSFRTIPVGLGGVPAMYQVSIRAPGNAQAEIATYTFPLTPTQLRADRAAMSSFTDTQGDPSNQGVARVMDTFGLAPPIYLIEGTTGWDRHSADGFAFTGLESMQMLKSFLAEYASLNQQQRLSGSPMYYTLEFYDYFMGEFWQVEPVGPQTVRQSVDRPTLAYYRFRWVAIQPAGVPLIGVIDALASLLATPAQQAIINTAVSIGGFLGAYSPAGVA